LGPALDAGLILPRKGKDMAPEGLLEPQLTPIALEILRKRYLKKDENGEPTETPRDMFWRVASTIASVEERYGATPEQIAVLASRFYGMMAEGYWLPNSPTLMNAGRPLGQLSACFVLPVEDELSNGKDGIYDTLKAMAIIHQSGGGTGFSFNRLRPNGSIVRSTTGVASGPVSFMSLYDASTNVVKQGGTRRGANMGILRVDHPDIEAFIDCKQDTDEITNFNVSVAITDEFMEELAQEDERAVAIWNKICLNAWATGEPGLFFIDEANRHNPVPHLGKYEATNPCGEQPLLPYDVCNLGSLNLSKFVQEDIQGELGINWEELNEYAQLSTRFLDNVIDANKYPLPEIDDLAKRIRRIGNGVMGWADMLIALGIPYGSKESLELADKVANYFVGACKEASHRLTDERGTFPEWQDSVHRTAFRNCNVTTIAPTGTISMIAGCSSGIEPLYAVAFIRNQAGSVMLDVNERFIEIAKEENWYSDELMERIGELGTIDLPGVPEGVVSLFQTSDTVSPISHVMMQARWQEHICSAISKTINLPKEATTTDVAEAYRAAYINGCKGVTVYRDGSRDEQVLSTGKTTELPKTRPSVVKGESHHIESPIGEMYVTVNTIDGNPWEVFVAVGKAGGIAHANAEAIGRLVSLSLRYGVPVDRIYNQLKGISSDKAVGFGPNAVLSGPDAVAQVLGRYCNGEVTVTNGGKNFAACPDCGSDLEFTEGCFLCYACGYSGCG
jgi:ribonucleoside-diphosphate reductase alpha chain